MSETNGSALVRIWRETECAEEPTAEESHDACRHAAACDRALRRLCGGHEARLPWTHLDCGDCYEWEG